MRSIYFLLYVIYATLRTALYLPKYWLTKGERDKFLVATDVAKWWGKSVFNSIGNTMVVIGEENIPKDETLLVISNHQSNFDIPALSGYLNVRMGFVSKREIGRFPIFGLWMKYFKCVLMDRSNPRKSITAIQEVIKNINEGYSQIIFPEGTRSRKHEMGPFKPGSLKIAEKTGVTILPVTIDGTYRMYEETKRIVKSSAKITIHKPIYQKDLTEEQRKNLASYIHEIVESAL